ncbi:hypothetical protein [Sorangium sp. So ce388]|uniref:hypothetical protein n=1 Tax=Sorangium sp. So ce388 TaxID=3133309 RepID=UPI003F5BC6A7
MMSKLGKVRTIPVLVGDVFTQGGRRLLVTGFDGARSICVDVWNGRKTRILTRRLQREYSRCGEVDTAAAHRRVAADMKEKRS